MKLPKAKVTTKIRRPHNKNMNGVITKAISGFYYVVCGTEVYECKARGNFRNAGVSPVVGDRVNITLTDSERGVVESIEPRRNLLDRPTIANIDKLFIISSFIRPSPDALIIDRMTALAVFNGIEPVIVFNKCDMGDFTEWQRIYAAAGFKSIVTSAVTGEGIDRIKNELCGCISAFSGNSGVGKSSILNTLFPELDLKTNEISEKLGRGKHTTRHTELFAHESGFVADTPGFSSLQVARDVLEFRDRLADCFPEFEGYKDTCRFTGCTHTCEKGCGVIEAVNSGYIEPTRHNSYKEIFTELKSIKAWELKGKSE